MRLGLTNPWTSSPGEESMCITQRNGGEGDFHTKMVRIKGLDGVSLLTVVTDRVYVYLIMIQKNVYL